MLNVIAVAIFAFVALALLTYYQWRQRRSLREILRGDSGVDQSPTELEEGSFFDRWERTALQAGLGWKRSAYYAAAGVGTALGTAAFLTGSTVVGVVALVAGLAGPYLYVKRAQTVRVTRFAQQLPQALFLAASVLRAGGTLLQAVDSIAAEMPDPIGGEFRLIQQQMRLQVPAHEAMAQAHERVGVREFAAVVVAAHITAEVGGNLAHIFDQVARSIIDAQNARRTVQAFTTEGRMSTNLMVALPFLVLGLLWQLSPDYFKPMTGSALGLVVLIGCPAVILTGWFVIRRMVDIRIF